MSVSLVKSHIFVIDRCWVKASCFIYKMKLADGNGNTTTMYESRSKLTIKTLKNIWRHPGVFIITF